MNLTINGQPRQVDSVNTVAELLVSLELDPRQVVVELNEQVIRRADIEQTGVEENDQLEILRFVGGG